MALADHWEDAQPLTRRGVEILHWSAAGKTIAEVGIALDISPNTVNCHLKNIYRKLDVGNRVTASARGVELDLIFTDHTGRKSRLQDAYRGFVEGKHAPLFALLAPNVEWIATAPDDIFPRAGYSVGVDAAVQRIGLLGTTYRRRRFLPRFFAEDADQIAAYLDVELVHLKTGAPMAFGVAHFRTFQGDHVTRYLELFNSALAERQMRVGSQEGRIWTLGTMGSTPELRRKSNTAPPQGKPSRPLTPTHVTR